MGIDAVRGLAAISVVVLHAVPDDFLPKSWAILHIWQAVPVFVILMGLNASPSIWRRFRRLMPAWMTVYLLACVCFALWSWRGLNWPTTVFGLPSTGTIGGYFVAVAFQCVLLVPALYWLRKHYPRAFLWIAGAVSLAAEMIGPLLPLAVYKGLSLRFAFGIALGMTTLAGNGWLAGLSAGFLIAYQLGFRVPWWPESYQKQSLLAAPYAAWLVSLGREHAPRCKWLARLGRASWTIFLVDILYHTALMSRLPLALDIILPLAFGLTIDLGINATFLQSRRHLPNPSCGQASTRPSTQPAVSQDLPANPTPFGNTRC